MQKGGGTNERTRLTRGRRGGSGTCGDWNNNNSDAPKKYLSFSGGGGGGGRTFKRRQGTKEVRDSPILRSESKEKLLFPPLLPTLSSTAMYSANFVPGCDLAL